MAVRHLFLDDSEIEDHSGLAMELGRPCKHEDNPVIRCKYPWEMLGIQTYGTVVYDEADGLFKIWYLTHSGPSNERIRVEGVERLANMTLLAYATSVDGVAWHRPDLGQIDFEGSRKNNLLKIGHLNVEGASILLEPSDRDPSRRYKAFYWEHGSDRIIERDDGSYLWGEGDKDGIWVSFSPDGINWTNYDGNPVIPLGSDTGQSVVWDPELGRYVAFGRFGAGGRKVARSESTDFVRWSDPELVLEPDEDDGPNTQFYGISVTLYEGLYIGLLWIFHIDPEGHLGGGRDVGEIDIQLVSSRDGKRWNRVCNREVFIPNGPEGSWDSHIIQAACRFITVDDQHQIYYNGSPCRHGKGGRRGSSQIGMASLRRDGFAYLSAGNEEGFMVTKSFPKPPGKLHVNVNARGGTIRVEYLNSESTLLSYPSSPMEIDTTDLQVTWGRGEPSPPDGTEIRLRFRMKNSKLYSYWFE